MTAFFTLKHGIVLGLAILVASCNGSPVAEKTSGDIRALPDTPIVYPASDYIQQGDGKSGGTLKLSVSRDNGSLDVHVLADTNSKWLGRTMFDNLVYLDDKGAITPWLAKSWTVSPDGLTYTFTLRDDVTFSDGEKLDAEAVRVNLARIRDPKTHTAMTTAYIAPYINGKVLAPNVFQATLDAPYAPFLNVLAQSWFGMIAPRQILERPQTIATAPIGTGPFIVEKYVRNQILTLVRRKDYNWAPDFVRHVGPAYLDRIEIVTLPEAMSRYAGLVSGQQNFVIDAPAQNATAIRADPDLVFRSHINLGNPLRGISFNVEKPPFDDVRVRRAAAIAIDRDGLTRSAGFGELTPTASFLSASTPYFDPAAARSLAYDPAAANRLLDSAGWTGRAPDGIRMKGNRRLEAQILTTDSNSWSFVAIGIQSDLKKIGFDLQLQPIPVTQFAARRAANDYQATGAGYWHTNTPDGLYIVYHGKQINRGQYTGQNITRIDDPALNDLLATARRGGDPVVLKGLYSKAQRRLAELVPAVPLFENSTFVAHRSTVRGLIFDTSHNTPLFTTIWLEDAKR